MTSSSQRASRNPDEYEGQAVALLGVPSDLHSSYLRGPAEAPGAIRAALHSESANMTTELGVDLAQAGALYDAGDLVDEARSDDFDAIERSVAALLERGPRVVAMGGDHAVTAPLVRALRPRLARLSILHIDAHPDLYEDFEGDPRSHASPFARLCEAGLVDRLVQVGVRTANAHLREQIERYDVECIEMRDWERTRALRFDGPLYVSFDLDVLDPAFAPGVSHWEPGGASTRQVLDLIQGLDADFVGADVVELNPRRDPSGMSAMVAARVLRELCGKLLASARARA